MTKTKETTQAPKGARKEGIAPVALRDATALLRQLADGNADGGRISDYVANETGPADFTASMAAIAECRAMLGELETLFRDELRAEVAYHEAAIARFEVAGLLVRDGGKP